MHVFVTGARGMLGKDLCGTLRGAGHSVVSTDLPDLDVTAGEYVEAAVREASPDLVIHLAALTDLDVCETHPEEAERVNTEGTRKTAVAAARAGAAFLYLSTGDIFDGQKDSPYVEFDRPNPLSVYGRTKLAGEELVRETLDEHYIVRSAWLFGGGAQDKKFVAKIIARARAGNDLRVVDDCIGRPTFTRDLAATLITIAESGRFGTYHAVGEGPPCTRHQLARRILACAGLDALPVAAVSSDEFPLPAPRPAMAALENLNLRLAGLPRPRSWQAALAEYIHELESGSAP